MLGLDQLHIAHDSITSQILLTILGIPNAKAPPVPAPSTSAELMATPKHTTSSTLQPPLMQQCKYGPNLPAINTITCIFSLSQIIRYFLNVNY